MVWFQSVTTSARAGRGPLISATSPTATSLPAANARRVDCDSRLLLIFRLLLNAEPVAPMAWRVGSEEEAFNARRRNGRSTPGNPRWHSIHRSEEHTSELQSLRHL